MKRLITAVCRNGGFSAFFETFVLVESSVIFSNFGAESPPLLQAAKTLAASVKDDRATTYRRLKTRKKQTILTGDQHTEHTQTGQRVSRPDVLYFLPNRNFFKTILASRTSGTFGFAPTHKPTLRKIKRAKIFQTHRYSVDNYSIVFYTEI